MSNSDDKKTYLERFLGAVIDIFKVLFYPMDPLVKISFVITVQICQMNFEPAKSTYTQRFSYFKLQQTPGKIVTNVAQMWRNGVCTSSEIQVVGEIESVTKELEKKKGRCEFVENIEREKAEKNGTHSSGNLNFIINITPL